MKPLRDVNETAKERAIRVMATGWCPWPYVRVPLVGAVGLDYKAECPCGKRIRVTARGLYSHHKMQRRITADEVRRG